MAKVPSSFSAQAPFVGTFTSSKSNSRAVFVCSNQPYQKKYERKGYKGGYPVPVMPTFIPIPAPEQEVPEGKSAKEAVNDQIDTLLKKVIIPVKVKKDKSHSTLPAAVDTAVSLPHEKKSIQPVSSQLASSYRAGIPRTSSMTSSSKKLNGTDRDVPHNAETIAAKTDANLKPAVKFLGFGDPITVAKPTDSDTFKLFLYAVDTAKTLSAIKSNGWREKVDVTINIREANAVIALKTANLIQGEKTAKNAGVPFIVVGRDMTAAYLRSALDSYVKEHFRSLRATRSAQSESSPPSPAPRRSTTPAAPVRSSSSSSAATTSRSTREDGKVPSSRGSTTNSSSTLRTEESGKVSNSRASTASSSSSTSKTEEARKVPSSRTSAGEARPSTSQPVGVANKSVSPSMQSPSAGSSSQGVNGKGLSARGDRLATSSGSRASSAVPVAARKLPLISLAATDKRARNSSDQEVLDIDGELMEDDGSTEEEDGFLDLDNDVADLAKQGNRLATGRLRLRGSMRGSGRVSRSGSTRPSMTGKSRPT